MATEKELLEFLRDHHSKDKTRDQKKLIQTVCLHYDGGRGIMQNPEDYGYYPEIYGRYIFLYASEHGYCEVLRYIIEENPNKPKDQKIYGFDPISDGLRPAVVLAAKNSNNIEALKYLLNVDPSRKQDLISYENYSLFGYVAKIGNLEAAEFLLGQVPDKMQRDQMIHRAGDYPMNSAAAEGHCQIVELLLAQTPDQVQKNEMISNGANYPLVKSAAEGHLKIIKLLVEQADKNLRDKLLSDRVLYHHISKGVEKGLNGYLEIAALIVENISDPEELADMVDKKFWYKTEQGRIFAATAFNKHHSEYPLSEEEKQKVAIFKALEHHYENGVMPPHVVAEFLEEETASRLEDLRKLLVVLEPLSSDIENNPKSNSQKLLKEKIVSVEHLVGGRDKISQEIIDYLAPANIDPRIVDDILQHFLKTIREEKAEKINEVDAAGKGPSAVISDPKLGTTSNEKASGQDSHTL